MLQPSTVVGRGTFIMVALCALGMGFMIRFFIALARDGRKLRLGSRQAPAARLALGVFRITTALAANSVRVRRRGAMDGPHVVTIAARLRESDSTTERLYRLG